jgi:hypothetical protein
MSFKLPLSIISQNKVQYFLQAWNHYFFHFFNNYFFKLVGGSVPRISGPYD